MSAVKIDGWVNDQHRLTADVPDSVPPGPVTTTIVTSTKEQSDAELWMAGIAHEWANERADERQDIYTLEDGKAVNES